MKTNSTLFYILLLSKIFLYYGIAFSQGIGIPAELIAKALNHAAAHPEIVDDSSDEEDIIIRLQNGDINALYLVAKSMNASGNNIESVLIWHHLADSSAHHIPSMFALGFAYEENNKKEAARYFVQAGEDGPHQAALYNAGRLFVELEEYDRALGYLLASINQAPRTPPENHRTTEYAIQAYETLSKKLLEKARSDGFALQEVVDMFLYGSIHNFPEKGSAEESLWVSGVKLLQDFGRTKERKTLEVARNNWAKLKSYGGLSDLQNSFLDAILKVTFNLLEDMSVEL